MKREYGIGLCTVDNVTRAEISSVQTPFGFHPTEPTPNQERLAPPEIRGIITIDVDYHGAGIVAVGETTTKVAAHRVAGMANHAVTNIVIIVNINIKVNIDHLHLLKILNDHHFECR